MADRVSLGAVLNSLITAGVIAGAVATTGVAVLAYRADASEQKVEKIDQRQRVLERDSAWTTKMLGLLLTERGIKVPPPPPLREITSE